MVVISEERAKMDELELFFYGFCSTQIYVDYRENIDNKLKFVMMELTKYYEEYTDLDRDYINEMLFKQYKTFWEMAELSLQKFYEEVQSILALRPNCIPTSSPEEVFCNQEEIGKLDTEIKSLQEKYETEKFFLHELKHRQEIVQEILQIKGKLEQTSKFNTNLAAIDALVQKRVEKMETFMENVSKKSLVKFVASDKARSNEKEKDMIEKFLQIRLQEKNQEE